MHVLCMEHAWAFNEHAAYIYKPWLCTDVAWDGIGCAWGKD